MKLIERKEYIDFNRNSTYIQSEGINQDFGVYDAPDDLLAEHQQEMSPIKALLYRTIGRFVMNRNVRKIRNNVEVPMVFLLYYNVMVQYGIEKFFKRCQETGVDGLIIPDLPYEESDEIKEYTEKYGVYQISLVSPTSKDRIKNIAKDAKGFLYCISSLGVTGEKSSFVTNFDEFVGTIKKYTDVPACVGFGVSNGRQVKELTKYFDGAIVGSAIVKSIATGESVEERINTLRAKIKDLKSGL